MEHVGDNDPQTNGLKKIPLDMTRFQKPKAKPRDASPFAEAVRLTAEMLGEPYIKVFGMVRNWPLHKIERRYKEAMNCNRELTTPRIRWFSLRKREREELKDLQPRK